MSEIAADLLDAAGRVMDRDGIGGLSITSIAAEAGVSRVTLHRRGDRVDDYVVGVLGRASDDLRMSLWPVLTSEGNGADRLRTALGVLCEVCGRHAGVMTAMFGVAPRAIPDRPGRTTSLEFIEPFERLVRDGVLDGTLESDDPLAEATLVANAAAWTYLHLRQAHDWPESDLIGSVGELVMAGVINPGRAP